MSRAYDDAAAAVQSYIESNDGFLSKIGGEVTRLDASRCEIQIDSVPVASANTTEDVAAHGGAVATLVDSAGGLAVRPHLDDPIADTVVTVSLDVDYLDAAQGELTARGEMLRRGGSMAFSRVDVESEGGLVAVGNGAFKIVEDR